MAEVGPLLRDAARGRGDPDDVAFASVLVLDDEGKLRAIWPENADLVGTNFAHRDYYRGAQSRADRKGAARVYLSRVYRSPTDGLDKMAVSIGFRPSTAKGVWVLAATIPTDPKLGLRVRNDDNSHKVVLLAPRDTGSRDDKDPPYLVLVHPAYSPRETPVEFPGRPRPGPDPDYRDPVGAGHSDCDGRWLAGFASVEDTEYVVLVQSPDEHAVASQRSVLRWFLVWAAALAVTGLALFVALRLGVGRRKVRPVK
jgi:hypothetical protein